MLSYTTHSSLALSLSGFVCVQVFEREGGIKEVESNNEYRNKYLGNQMDQLSDNAPPPVAHSFWLAVFDPIVLHFGCNLGLHSFGLNNTHYWEHLRSCLVKSDDCNNLSKKYKTLKQYKLAKLTPIEAGCCRRPSEAGVAQYMKTEWRVVAIFNVVLFVVLSIIYFVGCCVKQNAARSHSKV
ncbi:uncharacterized protein LOC114315889 isoform X5 [Camellia sinensis]|uniref:uncharacterized protein LOC114315889 isoform X5 n=1 Tax=Camellia sinensis TaxID=4442 RepID=UPI0010364BC4|nr:uncharacterized protein LOC114315889 isoform X5 [Camellia sinensis]